MGDPERKSSQSSSDMKQLHVQNKTPRNISVLSGVKFSTTLQSDSRSLEILRLGAASTKVWSVNCDLITESVKIDSVHLSLDLKKPSFRNQQELQNIKYSVNCFTQCSQKASPALHHPQGMVLFPHKLFHLPFSQGNLQEHNSHKPTYSGSFRNVSFHLRKKPD